MAEAIQDIHARESNHTLPSVHGDVNESLRYIQPLHLTRQALNNHTNINIKKLLLINFDWHTDWTYVRKRIWRTICQPENVAPFVTCFDKFKGVATSKLSEIYARNRQYSFWLSPRGNGIGCHRT